VTHSLLLKTFASFAHPSPFAVKKAFFRKKHSLREPFRKIFVTVKYVIQILMDSNQDFPEKFVPRGAVAFFALLVALGLIIWFTIYFIMLYRS
jgi:hypothetical protein